MQTPEMKALVQHEGSEAVGSTPQSFNSTLRTEVERWRGVAKAANIVAD